MQFQNSSSRYSMSLAGLFYLFCLLFYYYLFSFYFIIVLPNLKLSGVGQKVADCVSLFSLDKLDLVPVDTHVYQIAQRYMPSLKGKALSKSMHHLIVILI
jgi:hypothetical protein